jgi:hypothetical protein
MTWEVTGGREVGGGYIIVETVSMALAMRVEIVSMAFTVSLLTLQLVEMRNR